MGDTALRKTQIGKEVTAGTDVAATAILLGKFQLNEDFTIKRPDEDRGIFSRNVRQYIAAKAGGGVLRAEASYQQVLYALLATLKGGVTGVGAGADKTWTFAPTLTSRDTPDTFTIEFGDNQDVEQINYSVGSQLVFRGAVDEAVMEEWTIFGRAPADTTFTAALAQPAVTPIQFNRGALFIDATGAGIGVTKKSATFIDFSFTLPGFHPKRFADERLDFSAIGMNKRAAQVEATLEFNATGDAEKAAFRAETKRFIRFEFKGDALGASNYNLRIDAAVIWNAYDPLDSRDGNDVIRLRGETFYDATWAKELEIVVVNDLAALP